MHAKTDLEVKYLLVSFPKRRRDSGKGPRMDIMRASMPCTDTFWKRT
jgi:hypothetical protein